VNRGRSKQAVLPAGRAKSGIGGDEMKDKLIDVVFLGYQEQIKGGSIFLVNEVESHSTVKYDPSKHVLINKERKGGD